MTDLVWICRCQVCDIRNIAETQQLLIPCFCINTQVEGLALNADVTKLV